MAAEERPMALTMEDEDAIRFSLRTFGEDLNGSVLGVVTGMALIS